MKKKKFSKAQTLLTMPAKKRMPCISGVDLFCGAGGLTYGLIQGGVQIPAGVDLDTSCRYPYEVNNNAVFLEADVKSLRAEDLLPYFEKDSIRLLAGCAPCQPFSTYSQKNRGTAGEQKWDLVLDFGRLVKQIKPDLVTIENVPQLRKHRVFNKFLELLDGYHLWHSIVECVEYGVPQTRKRLVLLASRLGPIELIAPTHSAEKVNTLRNVISHLTSISAGERDRSDPLHSACLLSDLNLRRIKASKPGGTWRDWPEKLRSKCHRKETGQTYPAVYGRMEWDAPAPTITTQCFGYGNGRFGHPTQDRAISLREAAIIQTFPEDYQFVPKGQKIIYHTLGRLIGNAVPVRLGEVIAESLLKHVQKLHSNSLKTSL